MTLLSHQKTPLGIFEICVYVYVCVCVQHVDNALCCMLDHFTLIDWKFEIQSWSSCRVAACAGFYKTKFDPKNCNLKMGSNTARLDVKGPGWFIQQEVDNTLQNH